MACGTGHNWTFIVWGAIHGGLIICEGLSQRLQTIFFGERAADTTTPISAVFRWLAVLRTFALVCCAWTFFRARDVYGGWGVLSHVATGIPHDVRSLLAGQYLEGFSPGITALSFSVVGVVLYLELLDRRGRVLAKITTLPVVPRFAVYFAIVYITLWAGVFQTETQFIYFQF